MKKLIVLLFALSLISCNRYGEDGDGNDNLKHELLIKKCVEKPDFATWLFLRPANKKVCHYYYKGKKFSGTTVIYHDNGNIAFICTFSKGTEIVYDRQQYNEDGVPVENEYLRLSD